MSNNTLQGFQTYCWDWLKATFGVKPEAYENATSLLERNRRFFEEATELVQAGGMTREDAHRLVDYTFDKEPGDTYQELGGSMVTLASLAEAHGGMDMISAGWDEINRCYRPEVIERIRHKQASKQRHGIGGSPVVEVEPEPEPLPRSDTDNKG